MAELEGIRRVFMDSLVPAFERRGWDLKPLSKHRRKIAIGQATALLRVPKESPEFRQIRSALSALGDSKGLKADLWLIDHKLGSVLEMFAAIKLWLKDILKGTLSASKWSKSHHHRFRGSPSLGIELK
jgi:hypothetical protein